MFFPAESSRTDIYIYNYIYIFIYLCSIIKCSSRKPSFRVYSIVIQCISSVTYFLTWVDIAFVLVGQLILSWRLQNHLHFCIWLIVPTCTGQCCRSAGRWRWQNLQGLFGACSSAGMLWAVGLLFVWHCYVPVSFSRCDEGTDLHNQKQQALTPVGSRHGIPWIGFSATLLRTSEKSVYMTWRVCGERGWAKTSCTTCRKLVDQKYLPHPSAKFCEGFWVFVIGYC